MRRRLSIVAVTLLVGPALVATSDRTGLTIARPDRSADASTQADAQFEQIAALVTQKMAEYHVPGVAFGMVRGGQATVRGFGITNVEEPLEVTPETIFPIASISKTFTATAIMRLAEEGKLDIDAPVRRYVPEFAVQDEATSRDVAIWHLLTHTPGWEGQLNGEDRGSLSLVQFLDVLRPLPQLAPAGAVWSYNNAGFTLAGRVIETASGQGIHAAMRSLVFEPLGLTRAFTRLEDFVAYRFSVAHRTQNGKPVVTRPYSRSNTVTAGGIAISLTDLLAYATFHLGDGTSRTGQRVLGRETLERMRTPRVPKVGTDEQMGLGWHLRRVGGVMTAAHGGTLGHTLLLELVPDRGLAFAILTNHSDGWRLIQDVERQTLKLVAGVALDPAQAIGHRGVNETMPDAPLIAPQPDPAPYVGTYRRPPLTSTNTVRVENGQLMLDNTAIGFYAPDRAVITSGNSRGNPVEFLRRPDGTVGWIRVVGRIARKE